MDSVKYFDANDVEQTLPADIYEVVGVGGFGKARVVLKEGRCWPQTAKRAENVVIRFRAGYVTAGDNSVPNVPAAIKQAVRIMVADSYENRGGNFVSSSSVEGIGSKTYRQSSISGAVERILLPLRVW